MWIDPAFMRMPWVVLHSHGPDEPCDDTCSSYDDRPRDAAD